ncbi:Protein kinase domain-containing protein [Mycena sanguinolenta]|uniref:Protein kinase domain-containing protein n=1 Tax=Mycena sanguinolenta TaxID=230812 RepID=A0A8H6Y3H8_9AGAR|nr:Protein kinase domain-containing protein [Mycena sanguinolenta]
MAGIWKGNRSGKDSHPNATETPLDTPSATRNRTADAPASKFVGGLLRAAGSALVNTGVDGAHSSVRSVLKSPFAGKAKIDTPASNTAPATTSPAVVKTVELADVPDTLVIDGDANTANAPMKIPTIRADLDNVSTSPLDGSSPTSTNADTINATVQPDEIPTTQHEAFSAAQEHNGVIANNSSVVSTTDISDLREALGIIYEKDKDVISYPTMALAAVFDEKGLGEFSVACTKFNETSKKLIDSLGLLAQIHPLVQVVVEAFQLVTMLDMQQDNPKKVLVVKIQMQATMFALLQLRQLNGSANLAVEEATSTLMANIADAIKNCANVCAVYMNAKILARTIKSKEYEQQFADFVVRFREDADQILALVPNAQGEAEGIDVETMRGRLERVFRQLDTPDEHNLLEFLSHHSIQTCIDRIDVRADLVALAGYTLESFDRSGLSNPLRANKRLKDVLIEAHGQDVAQMCKNHKEQFNSTLVLLKQNLENVFPSPGRRVSDGDLSELWQKQGWRGNVKAQSFALALNYYYIEKFQEIGVPTAGSQNIAIPATVEPPKDQWAVAYLGVSYLRQIGEAADEDGAGYISIREANEFAARRPVLWSLPEWLAFCAAGWHTSVTWYRTRIYNILRAMVRAQQLVRSENLQAANTYLTGPHMWRVELLLRATRPNEKPAPKGKRLQALTDEYRKKETSQLERDLLTLNYKLDDNSLRALAKTRRAEYFVYPVLYLLLKRHFDVMRLACGYRFKDPTSEFDRMTQSIGAIFKVVDARIQKLRGMCAVGVIRRKRHFFI